MKSPFGIIGLVAALAVRSFASNSQMKSHTYNFNPKDGLWLVARPLGVVLLFAIVMQGGGRLHLLPRARPTLDTERTILIHQIEAAQKKSAADVILLGDSSCMMDVSARLAGEKLGQKVLNLGLLSYVNLNGYASMLRHYTAANPGSPRAVVLLMHPEALRRSKGEAEYADFLEKSLAGDVPENLGNSGSKIMSLLGVNSFKGRFLSRWVPAALGGEFGRQYGFAGDLDKYMDETGGSIIDPQPQPFQGNAEYSLAEQLQSASRVFKSAVPPGTRLFAAITPVPETFPRADYAIVHAGMLQQWSQWLGAEPLALPATMPDHLFAKTTHLNEAGVKSYTDLLTQALGRARARQIKLE